MAAVDLLVGEMAAVLVPAQLRSTRNRSRSTSGLIAFLAVDVEEVQLVGGELVAGQGVGARPQLGPAAAGGRRLDQVDLLAIARLDAEGDQRLRVGRPGEAAVGEAVLAVVAQLDFAWLAVARGR